MNESFRKFENTPEDLITTRSKLTQNIYGSLSCRLFISTTARRTKPGTRCDWLLEVDVTSSDIYDGLHPV